MVTAATTRTHETPAFDGQGFWREYELNSELVNCRIRENFRADTFDLGAETLMGEESCAWLDGEGAGGRNSTAADGGAGDGDVVCGSAGSAA